MVSWIDIVLSIGIGIASALIWDFLVKPLFLPLSLYYKIQLISNKIRMWNFKVDLIKTKTSYELKNQLNGPIDRVQELIENELKSTFKRIEIIKTKTPYIMKARINENTVITVEIEPEGTEKNEYPRIILIQETKQEKIKDLRKIIDSQIINFSRIYGHLHELLSLKYNENLELEIRIPGKNLFAPFFEVADTDTLKIGAKIILKTKKQEDREFVIIKIKNSVNSTLSEKLEKMVKSGIIVYQPINDA